jgi:acetyl-CoA acyltransferase 2
MTIFLNFNFQNICSGDSAVVLTGGVDNMSQSPHIVRGIRFGVPLGGAPVLEDSLWAGLTDSYCKMPMAITAENLADKYKISRDDVEAYALQSQQKWKTGKIKFSHNAFVTIASLILNSQPTTVDISRRSWPL